MEGWNIGIAEGWVIIAIKSKSLGIEERIRWRKTFPAI
jgi:hypothetical protein